MGGPVPDNDPPEHRRLSLVDALVSVRADVRPAIANALWPRLKAGPEAWHRPRIRIASSSGGGGIVTTTPPVPAPDARYRWETVSSEVVLYAFAGRVESRIGRGFTAKLFRTDYDALLRMLDPVVVREYRRAINEAVCERPFYRDPERPSGWKRNYKEQLLTERVAGVLEQLASLALVDFLTAEVEDALLS